MQRTLRQDIEIKADFDPEVCFTFADAVQLESAVLNLAVNAQDAMLLGGRLTISTANASLDDHYKSLHPEVIPGEYVLIAITDEGEGMSKGSNRTCVRAVLYDKGDRQGKRARPKHGLWLCEAIEWSRLDL